MLGRERAFDVEGAAAPGNNLPFRYTLGGRKTDVIHISVTVLRGSAEARHRRAGAHVAQDLVDSARSARVEME